MPVIVLPLIEPVEFATWMPFWALMVCAPPPVMVTPLMARSAWLNTVAFFWKSLIDPPVMVKAIRLSLSTPRATPRWTPLTRGSPPAAVPPG